MRLTLHSFLTLDGVMQAPGGPDEDPDGGFEHGGWSFPYGDEDFGATMTGWFANADAFLLGRKTYEIFSGHWPNATDADDPIANTTSSTSTACSSFRSTSAPARSSSATARRPRPYDSRPAEREVLALCVWAALEHAEVAETLGVPVGTVRSRLSRARRRLRQLTDDELARTSKSRQRGPGCGQLTGDGSPADDSIALTAAAAVVAAAGAGFLTSSPTSTGHTTISASRGAEPRVGTLPEHISTVAYALDRKAGDFIKITVHNPGTHKPDAAELQKDLARMGVNATVSRGIPHCTPQLFNLAERDKNGDYVATVPRQVIFKYPETIIFSSDISDPDPATLTVSVGTQPGAVPTCAPLPSNHG